MSDPAAREKDCLQRLLIAMIVADGDIAPEELATAQTVYRDLTGDGISDVDLRRQAEEALAAASDFSTCLGDLDGLDHDARCRLFRGAFAVASADGFVLEEEDALLANVAAVLGLTEAQYRGQLEQLTE